MIGCRLSYTAPAVSVIGCPLICVARTVWTSQQFQPAFSRSSSYEEGEPISPKSTVSLATHLHCSRTPHQGHTTYMGISMHRVPPKYNRGRLYKTIYPLNEDTLLICTPLAVPSSSVHSTSREILPLCLV